MNRVLIVSPHFPPINAPDVHRVRMSLPYYQEFGWVPTVLTVRPDLQADAQDPSLADTVPADIPVVRTGALPLALTRAMGIGNVALRAIGHLYRAGARLIRDDAVDLVYFSTTMFASMALGRLWKRRFGVPYVIDLQDPWYTNYYDDKPAGERPPKHTLARAMHRVLERWTMREVARVITVSEAYTDTLRSRYPWITPPMCVTIPFGASARDMTLAEQRAGAPAAFDPNQITGFYAGRGGPDMATAIRILCAAIRQGRDRSSRVAGLRLSFVGTDYAADGRARETVAPIALASGVGSQISESTARVPYFDALARLRSADVLIVVGSDDPQYSPSKIYPYLLARRPILAVVHEASPIADVLRRAPSSVVVTFSGRKDVEGPAAELAPRLIALLDRLPMELETDSSLFEPFSARSLTARQCLTFDGAIRSRAIAVPAPCAD
jgi:glycosyl transferase family 4